MFFSYLTMFGWQPARMAPRRTSRHGRQLPRIRLALWLCSVLLSQCTWACQAWIRSILLSSKNGTLSRSSSLERCLLIFSILYRHGSQHDSWDGSYWNSSCCFPYGRDPFWIEESFVWPQLRKVKLSIPYVKWKKKVHVIFLDGIIFLVLSRNGGLIGVPSYLTARTSLWPCHLWTLTFVFSSRHATSEYFFFQSFFVWNRQLIIII